jgi:dephospho-CoA kinase
MAVIGITGKKGCGKDTAARRLQDRHAFEMLDFTKDVLAPILVKRGMPVTRENLIGIAMQGREKSHNGVWAEKISAIIRMRPGRDFVISGVRFREEVEVFKRSLKDDFRLVGIVCDDEVRYSRVKKRGTKGEADISFGEFMEMESRPTERVIPDTMSIADFVIDNNGSLDDLYAAIAGLVKILKGR